MEMNTLVQMGDVRAERAYDTENDFFAVMSLLMNQLCL
jgi:hypothetical protein